MSKSARRQYGEGAIYEYTASGITRYRVQWREPSDPDEPEGEQRRRSKAGFATKKEAGAYLRDVLGKLDRGMPTRATGDDVSLGDYLEDWLDGLRLEGATIDGYRRLIRLHVAPYKLAGMPLTRVRPVVLAKHYRQLEQSGRRDHGHEGEPLGPNTVRKVHDVLSVALTAAQADDLIPVNPAKQPGAKPPTGKEIKKSKPDMEIWTPPELDAFLQWARTETPDLYVCWLLDMTTGLRRGELLGLRWGDVDLRAGRLFVRKALVTRKMKGQKEWLEEKLTKNTHDRVVDLEQPVAEALKEHRTHIASRDLQLAAAEARVITKRDGGAMRPDNLTRRWASAVRRFNADPATCVVPSISLHGLRHTHASHLLAAGVPVHTVSERLGHDAVVLLRTYAHAMPSAQQEGLAMLAAFRHASGVQHTV